MSQAAHDTPKPDKKPARERVVGQDGWIKPKHGRGMLRPWQPGNKIGVGAKGTRYTETVQFARQHSLEAMHTLVERLRDPDGRIAVVAANSLLERAWGKVREQKPEEREQMQIDLSALSGPELALLMKLAASGRIKGIAVETGSEQAPPPVIDGKVEENG